jgi:hypothetical protein
MDNGVTGIKTDKRRIRTKRLRILKQKHERSAPDFILFLSCFSSFDHRYAFGF